MPLTVTAALAACTHPSPSLGVTVTVTVVVPTGQHHHTRVLEMALLRAGPGAPAAFVLGGSRAPRPGRGPGLPLWLRHWYNLNGTSKAALVPLALALPVVLRDVKSAAGP